MASALTSASFGAFSMPSQSALSLLALRKARQRAEHRRAVDRVLALARDEVVGERRDR